jgi:hypothetical protein
MKQILNSLVAAGLLTVTGFGNASAAETSAGYVDFGAFSPSKNGSQFVEVNLSSGMIALAAGLAKGEPEVAELLKGIEGVRVNVIGLNDENRESVLSKLSDIRASMDKSKWDRLVVAQEKNQDVSVYVKTKSGDTIEGVVVLVQQGAKQAVFVNVVGNVNPAKLGLLGQKFDIAPLKGLTPKRAKAE